MTRLPGNLPFRIYAGRKFSVPLRLIDNNRDPLNITGFTVEASVKTEAGGTLILELDTTINNASAGLITLSKAHGDTAGIASQRGVWDILLINSSGEKLPPYVGGPAEIKTPVT